jgi:phosphoribosylformylglycinamidine cyclo-ligase
MIQESAETEWKEMYQVFNMGQRLEIYTDKDTAKGIIDIATSYKVDACISGYVITSDKKEVVIKSEKGVFSYE